MAKTKKLTYHIKVGLAKLISEANMSQGQFAKVAGITGGYFSCALQKKVKIGTAARAGILKACRECLGLKFSFHEVFEEVNTNNTES